MGGWVGGCVGFCVCVAVAEGGTCAECVCVCGWGGACSKRLIDCAASPPTDAPAPPHPPLRSNGVIDREELRDLLEAVGDGTEPVPMVRVCLGV